MGQPGCVCFSPAVGAGTSCSARPCAPLPHHCPRISDGCAPAARGVLRQCCMLLGLNTCISPSCLHRYPSLPASLPASLICSPRLCAPVLRAAGPGTGLTTAGHRGGGRSGAAHPAEAGDCHGGAGAPWEGAVCCRCRLSGGRGSVAGAATQPCPAAGAGGGAIALCRVTGCRCSDAARVWDFKWKPGRHAAEASTPARCSLQLNWPGGRSGAAAHCLTVCLVLSRTEPTH